MGNAEQLNKMIENARKALKEFEPYTQEQVDECVKTICLAFKEKAEEMARLAVEETGLGDVNAKIEKNSGSPDAIWYELKDKKSVGIIGEDPGLKLKYVATPKGILASVAPTTNPNVTVLFNAAYALKGRNALIVAPHPRAKKSTLRSCEVISDALKKSGAPDNLVQCIEEPSIELTIELMQNCDVVIATGGAAMVASAYSSGHPAFGVGPGNVQTIFDNGYSDYKKAIAQTVFGRQYDNGLICACNQSFIIPEEAEGELIEIMKAEKAVYFDDEETVQAFRKFLFPDGQHINPDVVGQNIQRIAKMMDLAIPGDAVIAVLKIDKSKAGANDPLCGEKMCPVAICISYGTFEEAVEIAKANLLYQGAGHSSVVHTDDVSKAEYCGLTLPVSRMMVNQPGVFAANPALANGFRPTSTLGCGSWGNNSISENLNFEHLINISRIGWVKEESDIPTPARIWGEPKVNEGYVKNMEVVAFHDLGGVMAFQMALHKTESGRYYIYCGSFKGAGCNIIDVTDPANPVRVKFFEVCDPKVYKKQSTPKVQVADGLLLVALGGGIPFLHGVEWEDKALGGLQIYSLADPENPVLLSHWETGVEDGMGVHRFSYSGGKYAYLTSECPGFVGFILRILDISDPKNPVEAGKWWMPEQFKDGMKDGAFPEGHDAEKDWAMLHGPCYIEDGKGYMAYFGAGGVIVGLDDPVRPKILGQIKVQPPFAGKYDGARCHTFLPLAGRDFAVLTNEGERYAFFTKEKLQTGKHKGAQPMNNLHMIDVSDPADPTLVAEFPYPEVPEGYPWPNFNIAGMDGAQGPFGPHNLHEPMGKPGLENDPNRVYCCYFHAGMRVYDVSDPYYIKEIAYFIPPNPEKKLFEVPMPGPLLGMAEDCIVDDRGYIYMDTFHDGLYILKLKI